MRRTTPFTKKRIQTIGLYLAEFALEFAPRHTELSSWEANDFLKLFDNWYRNFIRYAETNQMITLDEILNLHENLNGLDDLIKEAAIDAARDMVIEKTEAWVYHRPV
jgi:hypothetical protein